MKPHSFQPDPNAQPEQDPGGTDICDLCGEDADHPIHELDGVAPGDAEDDETTGEICEMCSKPAVGRDSQGTPMCMDCDDSDNDSFTPPDGEPDSGFDVREEVRP